jgi:hypothetical protein
MVRNPCDHTAIPHARIQLRYREDCQHAGHRIHGRARSSDFSLSIQNVQMDNQLSNASFPVMLCRRDISSTGAAAGTASPAYLLKAAQRQWEQQAQGPPLVQVHVERLLRHTASSCQADGNVFLKCVTLTSSCLSCFHEKSASFRGSAACRSRLVWYFVALCLSPHPYGSHPTKVVHFEVPACCVLALVPNTQS